MSLRQMPEGFTHFTYGHRSNLYLPCRAQDMLTITWWYSSVCTDLLTTGFYKQLTTVVPSVSSVCPTYCSLLISLMAPVVSHGNVPSPCRDKSDAVRSRAGPGGSSKCPAQPGAVSWVMWHAVHVPTLVKSWSHTVHKQLVGDFHYTEVIKIYIWIYMSIFNNL